MLVMAIAGTWFQFTLFSSLRPLDRLLFPQPSSNSRLDRPFRISQTVLALPADLGWWRRMSHPHRGKKSQPAEQSSIT
jgi:hypothetical protein